MPPTITLSASENLHRSPFVNTAPPLKRAEPSTASGRQHLSSCKSRRYSGPSDAPSKQKAVCESNDRVLESASNGLESHASPPDANVMVVASPTRIDVTPTRYNLADEWVDRRAQAAASSTHSRSFRVPTASTPSKKWWAAHPSAKIKHRTFKGSRDDAMVLASKLRQQLLADPDTWSTVPADPSLLPNIACLIADGRASTVHQFKLSQGIAPPRQFSPRSLGQNPGYSLSANREAIDWFATHPQPSLHPASTPTSLISRAPAPSHLLPGNVPYQPSTYACAAPFNQRMSTSTSTPQWIRDIQQGLPIMHSIWA